MLPPRYREVRVSELEKMHSDLESMRARIAELEVMVKMPSSLITCVLAHVDEGTECRVCVRAARVLKRQIDAAMRAEREATE